MGLPQSEATKGGDLRSCCGGGGKGFRLVFMLGFWIIETIFEGHSACLFKYNKWRGILVGIEIMSKVAIG